MPRSFLALVSTLAVTGIVAGCTVATGSPGTGSLAPSPAVATSPTAAPSTNTDLLADLDVGGRSMHILCVGPIDTGRPTVIFESGLGGDAGQWLDVIFELDRSVRACAYDRAGNGQSEPADAGRTTTDQVADLRALLVEADVPPPYVLVGYSVGGWNVLIHADAHPDDVVGAVMVDVRPPIASQRWKDALPPEASGEPEAIHLTRTDPDTFEKDPTQNPEGLSLADSAAQAEATAGFGGDPLIVLAAADTSAVTEGFDPALGATMATIWWDLQEALATRSTAGALVKVEGATHEMPFERPDAIADAIREVLGG